MDVKSYCDTVGAELTGWKAKLYDVIRRTEEMTGNDKENVTPMVAELSVMLVTTSAVTTGGPAGVNDWIAE